MQDRLWFFGTIRSWAWRGSLRASTNKTLLTPPGAAREVVKVTPWEDRLLDRLSGRLEA